MVVVDVVVVVVVVVVGRGGEGNSWEYYRALWVDQVNMKLWHNQNHLIPFSGQVP